MANLNPNISGLKKIPKIAPEGSAHKPVQVRVPASQYEVWMSLPAKERNDYLRKAIAEKLEKDGLLPA
ncbi:MAG: hypothetical protein HC930_07765 [Hydrococcus sp. SU_1_0]|nr:hypothetical protein [Hydrococcus sp. SU_1_0]